MYLKLIYIEPNMFLMIKKFSFCFFYILLSMACSYGQTNPFYKVTQENIPVLSTNSFSSIFNYKEYGNRYGAQVIPAHTTFLIENNLIVNVTSSMHIQGIPIGFKFPYVGQEFDIYALNGKGYMVLGKSWEGGMTIYADTLIETATDTIFTNKNKYLISGLYTGKNLDYLSYLMFDTENIWGFPGEKKTRVGFDNYYYNNSNGTAFNISSVIEFLETGEMKISNEIQTINTNAITNTYATFLQHDGSSNTQSLAGTGTDTNAWWNTVQAYSATDIKFGFLSNTVKPLIIYGNTITGSPALNYIIRYKPLNPVYVCPIPIIFNSNPPRTYADSAYLANDYKPLAGDTIETSDKVWWFSDMRDSMRFDIYLGTDEVSMQRYKSGLVSDTFEVFTFNFVTGMVTLHLDSLAPGQHYFMHIQSIHPSGDTTVCDAVSFYTKSKEANKTYCRSDEHVFDPGNDAFSTCFLDLNTLHFHPTSNQIVTGLAYKTIVPDTGSWTTTLQQGQSYTLQLSCPKWNYQPATSFMVSVYMDYNGDGIFDSPAQNNDNHTFGISDTMYRPLIFSIPSDAIIGKTRLRIAVRFFCNNCPFPGACETGLESHARTYVNFEDFTVTIAQAPGCNLSYNDTIISPSCATYSNGGLSIIPQGGTAPYHLQWNTGNLKDTLFTLSSLASPARQRATITDAAGCNVRTSMLQLTQPAPLHIDTMLHSSPAWIAFSGGTKPYHAEITGDKTETRYAVHDTISLTDLSVGNYHIKATDSNACDMQEYMFRHSIKPDTLTSTDFILYPNPATNYIQIGGINNSAAVIVYSADGKKVFEGMSTNQQIILLTDVASALYLVRITEEGRTKTIKLIIK